MRTAADVSDADLARAITAREPGAAEAAESELYRRFAPRVRLYGLRHLRDEDAARDLVQQAMLLTIEKLRDGAIRDLDQIASFILGVSRTMARDIQRREWRREKLRATFVVPDNVQAPADDGALDVDQLERCLAQLGARDRLVVLLTFYGEKSASEVARELRVEPGHVRVIRHRAVDRLRACVTARKEVS